VAARCWTADFGAGVTRSQAASACPTLKGKAPLLTPLGTRTFAVLLLLSRIPVCKRTRYRPSVYAWFGVAASSS
jgi:hypothetical protein